MDFVVQQFLTFAKAHPWLTSTNVLLSMTFPIDDVLVPYLSGRIVTLVQERKPWLKTLVALIAILVFMQLFYTLSFWHDAKMFPQLQNHIRKGMLHDIMEHYQQTSTEVQTGEVMSRLVKIPMTTVMVFEQMKNYLGAYVLSFFVTAIYVFMQNWVVGLVLTLAGLMVVMVIISSPQSCKTSAMRQEKDLEELDEATEDVLRNLSTVYTSDQVKRELSTIASMGKMYERDYLSTTTCTMVRKFMTVVILSAMLIFFGCYSYKGIQTKTMKIGFFVSVFIIIIQWYSGLGWLSSHIKGLVMDWGILTAHARLFKSVRDGDPTLTSAAIHAKPITTTQLQQSPAIFVDRLEYSVTGRGHPILHDISLQVKEGETVGIVGHVGSGKSTLLKIIARLIKPTAGEVYFYGKPLSQMSMQESRSIVGYVQQQPQLFNRSIYENIVYGNEDKPNASRESVNVMVASLGLGDAFSNMPQGLDTLAGKNGSVLSGGQRQLVQMMRLILTDPQIIILDEVTASLDGDTKKKLFNLLDVALKGKTTLLVTHDPELMRRAQRIIHFSDGEIAVTNKAQNSDNARYYYGQHSGIGGFP